MTDTPVHLAVDLGASSGRVIAGRITAGRLELEEVHRFVNEPVPIQNSLQWNLNSLWNEILKGLRLAAQKYSEIRSVGVDSWGVDYVLLDDNDQLAGPVRTYRDHRTDGMLERAFEKLGGAEQGREKIFAATGLQFMSINTLYQLFAAVEHNERSMEIADAFLMIGDYFHWLLTGKRSVEATNASTSQLLNPVTGQWADELLQPLGIPRKIFAPVSQPGTTLGHVQSSVAADTGLTDVPVILPATHDTASAVIAVPADEFAPEHPSWCYISSGTWSLMGCEVAAPKINNTCSELNFTNEGGVAGSTRLLKNIGGLWIFQQVRKSMQRRQRTVDWDAMVAAASGAKAFELLIDPDAKCFVAPGDMVDAIDAFAVSTGQPRPTDDATYYRAALEGLALRYRVCLSMLERLVGNRIDTIHIVGGGAMNELLCQMTADACDRRVVAGPVEATAIGNVVMQLIGTGQFDEGNETDMSAAMLSARKLIKQSFDVKVFDPHDADAWNEPADRFVKLTDS